MDGVAFVYRWLDIETASKYVMTLGLQVDGEITETMGVEDKAYLLITEYANSFYQSTDNGIYESFWSGRKRSSV